MPIDKREMQAIEENASAESQGQTHFGPQGPKQVDYPTGLAGPAWMDSQRSNDAMGLSGIAKLAAITKQRARPANASQSEGRRADTGGSAKSAQPGFGSADFASENGEGGAAYGGSYGPLDYNFAENESIWFDMPYSLPCADFSVAQNAIMVARPGLYMLSYCGTFTSDVDTALHLGLYVNDTAPLQNGTHASLWLKAGQAKDLSVSAQANMPDAANTVRLVITSSKAARVTASEEYPITVTAYRVSVAISGNDAQLSFREEGRELSAAGAASLLSKECVSCKSSRKLESNVAAASGARWVSPAIASPQKKVFRTIVRRNA